MPGKHSLENTPHAPVENGPATGGVQQGAPTGGMSPEFVLPQWSKVFTGEYNERDEVLGLVYYRVEARRLEQLPEILWVSVSVRYEGEQLWYPYGFIMVHHPTGTIINSYSHHGGEAKMIANRVKPVWTRILEAVNSTR